MPILDTALFQDHCEVISMSLQGHCEVILGDALGSIPMMTIAIAPLLAGVGRSFNDC